MIDKYYLDYLRRMPKKKLEEELSLCEWHLEHCHSKMVKLAENIEAYATQIASYKVELENRKFDEEKE
jgi:hypothetical protein